LIDCLCKIIVHVKNLFVLHALSHQKYLKIKRRYYATSCFAKKQKIRGSCILHKINT